MSDHSALAQRRPRKPPILFGLARAMIRADIPGGWRLWRTLLDMGALAITAEYVIAGPARATPMRVPLDRQESSWSEREIADYSANIVDATLRAAAHIKAPFTLIDCGADIGMLSASFLRASERIASLIAFEPNPTAFDYLSQSVALWNAPWQRVQVRSSSQTIAAVTGLPNRAVISPRSRRWRPVHHP